MQILHGTWIPEVVNAFIQRGTFVLWAESSECKRFRKPSQRHPRQLVAADLAALLTDELGVTSPSPYRKLEEFIQPQYFLLPTVDDQPLPSLELSRYLEAELPETFDLQYWQVDCYATVGPAKSGGMVNTVVTLLNDLHFLALHNLAEVQLGADLLFWFHYTQALKRTIFKDQYIPALKYRELPVSTPAKRKSTAAEKKAAASPKPATEPRRRAAFRTRRSAGLAKKTAVTQTVTQTIDVSAASPAAPPFEVYAGWEFIGEEYETLIRDSLEFMPLFCGAGFAEPPSTLELYNRKTLLRHFSECLLTDIVTHIPVTQAFAKMISGSILEESLAAPGAPSKGADALKRYQQWQDWRDRIVRTQTDQLFHLCFRLQDPAKPEDPWELQFQVAPKSDPSLQVALSDYWRMRPKQQQQVQRQMGDAFEQHLLMNLGYAARIYPDLWRGLETDQPVGIALNLEAAFAFLKETAWVLENAGYRVIVPAWWTPQGRQRAKVRLKAKGKSLTGGEDKTKKYFSFDSDCRVSI